MTCILKTNRPLCACVSEALKQSAWALAHGKNAEGAIEAPCGKGLIRTDWQDASLAGVSGAVFHASLCLRSGHETEVSFIVTFGCLAQDEPPATGVWASHYFREEPPLVPLSARVH